MRKVLAALVLSASACSAFATGVNPQSLAFSTSTNDATAQAAIQWNGDGTVSWFPANQMWPPLSLQRWFGPPSPTIVGSGSAGAWAVRILSCIDSDTGSFRNVNYQVDGCLYNDANYNITDLEGGIKVYHQLNGPLGTWKMNFYAQGEDHTHSTTVVFCYSFLDATGNWHDFPANQILAQVTTFASTYLPSPAPHTAVRVTPYTNQVIMTSGGSPVAQFNLGDDGHLTIGDNKTPGNKVDTDWIVPRALHNAWYYWTKITLLDGDWGSPNSQHLYLIGGNAGQWYNGQLLVGVSRAGTGFRAIGHFRVDIAYTNNDAAIIDSVTYGVDLQR